MLDLKRAQKTDPDEKKDQDTVHGRQKVVGTSPLGFDDAVADAIETAASVFPGLDGARVKHMTVAVQGGKVVEYRVEIKVKDDDEDD